MISSAALQYRATIRIGTTGDEAVSKQLIDKIKSHLTWL
jgi:hypothetical protein